MSFDPILTLIVGPILLLALTQCVQHFYNIKLAKSLPSQHELTYKVLTELYARQNQSSISDYCLDSDELYDNIIQEYNDSTRGANFRTRRSTRILKKYLDKSTDALQHPRSRHLEPLIEFDGAAYGITDQGSLAIRTMPDEISECPDILAELLKGSRELGTAQSGVTRLPTKNLAATSDFSNLSRYEQQIRIRREVFKAVMNAGTLQRPDLGKRVEEVLRGMGWQNMNDKRRKRIKDAITWSLDHEYIDEDDSQIELGANSSEARSLELHCFRDKKTGRTPRRRN